jgi:hypothetical protein
MKMHDNLKMFVKFAFTSNTFWIKINLLNSYTYIFIHFCFVLFSMKLNVLHVIIFLVKLILKQIEEVKNNFYYWM